MNAPLISLPRHSTLVKSRRKTHALALIMIDLPEKEEFPVKESKKEVTMISPRANKTVKLSAPEVKLLRNIFLYPPIVIALAYLKEQIAMYAILAIPVNRITPKRTSRVSKNSDPNSVGNEPLTLREMRQAAHNAGIPGQNRKEIATNIVNAYNEARG